MGTNTVFTLRVILSTAFRKKASGLSDDADEGQIDQAKVSTQVKLTMAAVNDAYLNQASIFLQVAEMVNLPQSDASDLNSCIALGALDDLALDRRKHHQSSFSHAFLGCEESGLNGVADLGGACTDWSAGVSFWRSVQSWETIAHEIGHQFTMTHPFERYGGASGTYGSLMDYVDKRLRAEDGADVGQVGFSYRLNGDQFCKELKAIFTPGKQFSTPQCYKSMSTAVDDFDDLFKECDQETECCVNGKWVHPLANCYQNDGECCNNCQKPDIPRTCTFRDNNPNSGICNNGKCELFGKVDTAVCAIHTKRVCTQEKLFYAVHSNQERCKTQCWVFDQQCAGPSYFHDYHNQMDLYSPCYRTSGPDHDFSTPPVKGRCLPDPNPAQSGVIRCYGPGDAQYDTLWAGRFQWEAILTNEPYCKNANFTNNVQPKYILLCRGPEGNTVGADHCKDVAKPATYQPTLDCTTFVKDFTTKYDTAAGEQITPKWKYTVGSKAPSGPHYATLSLYVKGQEYALIDTQVNLRDQQYVYTLPQGLPPTRNAYFLLQNNGVRIYTNKFTHAGGGDDTYIPPVPDNSGGGDNGGGDNGGGDNGGGDNGGGDNGGGDNSGSNSTTKPPALWPLVIVILASITILVIA